MPGYNGAVAPRVTAVALALAAAALAGCAHTPPSPDAQEVDELTLEGARQLPPAAVKEHIVTSESSWWPSWVPLLGRVGWFEPTTWQADLRRITRYYEAHGYYQARVLEEQVLPAQRAGHVKLLVRLREGDPARVASLAIGGLDGLTPEQRATVLDKLPLKVGDIFLEDAWARTRSLLAARLRELGYAEAVLKAEAVVDAEAARVDATVEVTAGLRYRFGKVLVATDAAPQVPPRIIAEVASPDVKPGDWFSEAALAEAQARVYQMGVFGAVKVNRGAPDPERGTVPVVIDVREAPFHGVRLGAGFAGDLIRNEVRVVGEYTNRNLGLARLFDRTSLLDRLTLKAKLGWAVVPDVVTAIRCAAGSTQVTGCSSVKQGPIARLFAEYEVPRIFNQRTLGLRSSVDLSRALDNAYDYFGGEAKLGLDWRPRLELIISPSVNFDAFFLSSPVGVGSTAPTAAIGCPQLPAACLVGYVGLRVEYDRRDQRLEPRQGYYLALDLQGGLSQVRALVPYARAVPEARGYLSFGPEKNVTVAGKLKLGTLLAPGNETSIVSRFFSGGSDMRGFSTRRLSPMVAVAGKDPAGAPDYAHGQALSVGGSGLAEASLEVRWNLSETWVLAVFNDWGLVTSEPLGLAPDFFSNLYAAVGLGVRYRTPLGPIRLDLAYRLPLGRPQSVTQASDAAPPVQVTPNGGCFFGLGKSDAPYAGSPENLCAFHLSVGEAF